MNIIQTERQLNLRKLSKQLVGCISEVSAKRIMVTSPKDGDGKSRFVAEINEQVCHLGHRPFTVMDARDLLTNPPPIEEDNVVIVRSPSFMAPGGLVTMPNRWIRFFDAAIVVVASRRTRAKELKQLVGWLESSGIEHIWPVWNEHLTPSIIESVKRFFRAPRRNRSPSAIAIEQKELVENDKVT
ncbi:MAG: hypothetical protein QNJ97_10585 [Myxococcota bacterium]|nr:hypothetical protein [Myxococcota bacterium]